jgi:hypothetical protein
MIQEEEYAWGFQQSHFENLELDADRLEMLLSAVNAMIRYCEFEYYQMMREGGDDEIKIETCKSVFSSSNLPRFELRDLDSYAQTPSIKNPKVVYVDSDFIQQFKNANDEAEKIRVTFLFSTVICHELAHVCMRRKENKLSPRKICREEHSGYHIEETLH